MPQFRAKARAVDLLGKGQIADLPTAISELWKNGYDAYGDNLEASLYEKGYEGHPEPVFVVSDDGKGMDETDILDKWFVLGTDSKTRGERDIKGPDTLNKEPRIKMGEKGIGRLAVAYLGPQMLLLTKKINYPLEMVFFDWRILENYNLFLSDVNIPQRAITSAEEIQNAFKELKDEFLNNFPKLKPDEKDLWREQRELRQLIINDCNRLSLPEFISSNCVATLLANPTRSHATRFIIFKPEQQILDLPKFGKSVTAENTDEISVNYTMSSLAGLFNRFKSNIQKEETHFWVYPKDNTGRYDLLNVRAFFDSSDFETCDHLINGSFDSEGKFSGSVRVYNKTIDHTFKPQSKRTNTWYGPFTIKLGYVQREEDETKLSPEEKRRFEEKLELYSGLFIYRDGFRVLPYGRPDTDFLEFEERRSKGAGTYFFSKRRMFGYIEISREDNERLKDKSSREGFINNQAFRDFKVDLIAFFKDLAKKYFATDAKEDYKRDQQEELRELARVAEQENQRDIQARKAFAQELRERPKQLQALQRQFDDCIKELEKKSGQTNIIYEEIEVLLRQAEDIQIKISDIRIKKPVRYKPTELQTKNYHAYTKSYNSIVKHIEAAKELFTNVRSKLKVHEMFKAYQDKAEFFKNTLLAQFNQLSTQLEDTFRHIREVFESEKNILIDDFENKYNSITPAPNDSKEINRSVKLLENIFEDSRSRVVSRITPYLEHLKRLSFDVNEDELVGYYKQKFEEIKEEWNQTYELAQLGIAVEIIDHQFNTLYAQLAESISTLQQYMVTGKEADNKFKHLYTAFEHLQDNYKLLQPLYRTTGRIRTEVLATELKSYTEEFFGSKLSDNRINVTISEDAKRWKVKSFESIFKPVTINIVNNAIYWLQSAKRKEIRFDVDGDALLIMNSGEPIEDYMLEDVFKLFYSSRPSGRGIGLYLAKHSLRGIGYDIEATNDPKLNKLGGACFLIKPIDK